MSTISIIGAGSMAAAIAGLATRAGHTVEVMGRDASFVTPADSFGAQEIARAAPADAVVVKAFNTLFSHVLAAGAFRGRPLDVFIAGDDAQAKARVAAFVGSLGLRAMEVGLLPMARTLEHVCLLSLGLLSRAVNHTNFTIGVSLPG